nr:putative metalloprotease CJM1_0395 family protein [Nautilia profundicola]
MSKLQAVDTKVKAHEMAHQAAGGGFAGAPSYTKVKGPDGKEYAVAGEVPIKIVKGKTPEETIKNMQQIKAAALAPADPSPQDLKVAQTADMIAANASQELSEEKSENKDSSDKKFKIDLYA